MSQTDLETILANAKKDGLIYLNNMRDESRILLGPEVRDSMLHAHIYSTFAFVEAMATFHPVTMDEGIDALKHSMELIKKNKRRHSIINIVNYENYNIREMHAELCYAEGIFMYTILSFFRDENWVKFVKFGVKVRKIYNYHRTCYLLMKKRKWNMEDELHREFLSGVHMCIGSFYLVMSFLPEKVLAVLRTLGFSGNLQMALKELEEGHELVNSGRAPICSLMLLGYQLILRDFHEASPINVAKVGNILNSIKTQYPNGTFTLFLDARFEMVQGNIEKALIKFDIAIASAPTWNMELYLSNLYKVFCYIYLLDYESCRDFSYMLFSEDKFTKSIFGYCKAMFMYLDEVNREKNMGEIMDLMQNIPKWTRKIGGRTPPLEKVVARKAKRFLETKRLVAPPLEFLYLIRGFQLIESRPKLLENMVAELEHEMKNLDNSPNNKYLIDEKALLLIMKASCLKYLERFSEAESCLEEVIGDEKNIKNDTHLIPFAYFELGQIQRLMGNWDRGMETLKKASKFSGHLMENRLRVRIKAAMNEEQEIATGVKAGYEAELPEIKSAEFEEISDF